jgi:hypothetical protein
VQIVRLDLAGVLVPEIWIAFSERTGIPDLRRTTRDEPDHDRLAWGMIRASWSSRVSCTPGRFSGRGSGLR